MSTTRQGGTSRRVFVTSLLASGTLASGGLIVLAQRRVSAPTNVPFAPDQDYPLAVDARPVVLEAGDLLVTDQANGSVLHVRDGQPQPLLQARSWSHSFLFDAIASRRRERLWVSLTGLNVPGDSYYFGVRGVGRVIEIDTRSGRLTRVFASPDLIDPAGLALSADEEHLFAADFNSFGTDGKLHRIDLRDGEITVITHGEHLTTPVGLSPDGPDHVVLGVAQMPEVGPDGGRLVRVDLRTGTQTVVHEHPKGMGELIGALSLPNGAYASVRSEWPQQEQTALFLTTGGSEYWELHHPRPGFMSSGLAWSGQGIWVGESTRREIRHISLDGALLARIALPGERDGDKLKRASKTLESVRLVA